MLTVPVCMGLAKAKPPPYTKILGWRFAPKKIFKAKIFLRHYKVIALALGAPGADRGPRDARTELGTTRS